MLCGRGVRGAAFEPASHERIDQRGKSQSSGGQHEPRVKTLIGRSLEVVSGVHLALLPVRRREQPCAGSYSLALRISPALSRRFGPRVITDMHDQSVSRTSGRTRVAIPVMCVRALLIVVLKSAGNFTRGEYQDHLSAEKVRRVKLFCSRGAKFMRHGNFRTPAHATGLEYFRLGGGGKGRRALPGRSGGRRKALPDPCTAAKIAIR